MFFRRMTPRRLAEREGKPIALRWVDAAASALRERPGGELARAALATAFKVRDPAPAFVARVLETLARSRAILLESDRWFYDASEREARELFVGEGIPPAYAIGGQGVFFTPRFEPHDPASGRGFGPRCRAAMVLHETVHVFDERSGEDAIHVSEWDEPRFSAQTPEESLHNPSAYACLAAQIAEGRLEWPRDERYGAGRPAD
ncbi:MAG TPA: hypothetical protein VFS43_33050 [Polyangiaceae bacterium]|nr:hypothetical protein [Polyangiaceae bacterium]